MRKILVLIGMTGVTLCALYLLLDSDTSTGHSKAVMTESAKYNAPPRSDANHEAPVRLPREDVNSIHMTALNNRISEIESKVHALGAAQQLERKTRDATRATASTPKLSDVDFGNWMDMALETAGRDSERTNQAQSLIQASLDRIQGIELKELSCGSRFGRALLVAEDGNPPEIRELFGAAPFDGEGFTIENANGSITVYFAPPGVTLRELRDEALAETAS